MAALHILMFSAKRNSIELDMRVAIWKRVIEIQAFILRFIGFRRNNLLIQHDHCHLILHDSVT